MSVSMSVTPEDLVDGGGQNQTLVDNKRLERSPDSNEVKEERFVDIKNQEQSLINKHDKKETSVDNEDQEQSLTDTEDKKEHSIDNESKKTSSVDNEDQNLDLGNEGRQQDLSPADKDIDLKDLPLLTDQLKKSNVDLSRENQVLVYYKKLIEEWNGPLDPKFKTFLQDIGLVSEPASLTSEVDKETFNRSSKGAATCPTLTISQKCFVAGKKLEDLRETLSQLKDSRDEALDLVKVKVATVSEGLETLQVEKCHFKNSVIVEHPLTKRVMAEKVEHYFKVVIKKKNGTVLMMKTAAENNKNKRKKTKEEINEKLEELKVLVDIEIHEAQIENQNVRKLITYHDKLYYSLRIKLNRLMHQAAEIKRKVHAEELVTESLRKKIYGRERAKIIFEFETQLVKKEKEECALLEHTIVTHPMAQNLPKVMDYVHLRAYLESKRKVVSQWKKKVAAFELITNFT